MSKNASKTQNKRGSEWGDYREAGDSKRYKKDKRDKSARNPFKER